jgi:hypothetical protein
LRDFPVSDVLKKPKAIIFMSASIVKRIVKKMSRPCKIFYFNESGYSNGSSNASISELSTTVMFIMRLKMELG